MSRLPRLRAKELLRVLKKEGFNVVRIKGSHHFLRHADGRTTVVPVHTGETIGPGLLMSILKDCEMTSDDLTRRLQA